MKFLRVPQPKCLLGNKTLYVPIHTIETVTVAGNILFLNFSGQQTSFHYNSEKESQQAADFFMSQLTKEKSFTLSPQDLQVKSLSQSHTQRTDMPAPCALAMEELK